MHLHPHIPTHITHTYPHTSHLHYTPSVLVLFYYAINYLKLSDFEKKKNQKTFFTVVFVYKELGIGLGGWFLL